jgi:hypothetical protein
LNFQQTSQLRYAFSHPTKTYTDWAARRTESLLFLRWDTLTCISDLNLNSSLSVGYSDNRIATTRMAVDIRQTLMDDPKDGNLYLITKTTKVTRNVEADHNLASF